MRPSDYAAQRGGPHGGEPHRGGPHGGEPHRGGPHGTGQVTSHHFLNMM